MHKIFDFDLHRLVILTAYSYCLVPNQLVTAMPMCPAGPFPSFDDMIITMHVSVCFKSRLTLAKRVINDETHLRFLHTDKLEIYSYMETAMNCRTTFQSPLILVILPQLPHSFCSFTTHFFETLQKAINMAA